MSVYAIAILAAPRMSTGGEQEDEDEEESEKGRKGQRTEIIDNRMNPAAAASLALSGE